MRDTSMINTFLSLVKVNLMRDTHTLSPTIETTDDKIIIILVTHAA